MRSFAELAFTPAVRALQERHGSRAAYARHEREGGPGEGLGAHEQAFLARADHFFLATVSESGWPYVQHRGGPRGFLRVISPTRLAFAEPVSAPEDLARISFDIAEGGLVRERNYDDGGMRSMLSNYASSMGVSKDLVFLAERTSPDQLYMLTPSDIARWRPASPPS